MEEEQYCLKWNNHQTTLLSVLSGLMDSEKLADCILSAEGKSIKAHQVVISACSPYLEVNSSCLYFFHNLSYIGIPACRQL